MGERPLKGLEAPKMGKRSQRGKGDPIKCKKPPKGDRKPPKGGKRPLRSARSL